jgi:hypothetical protein
LTASFFPLTFTFNPNSILAQRVDLYILLLTTLSLASSSLAMGHVPSSELLPDFLGEIVDGGRLKLVERLGSGAYGIVYKALDTTSPIDSPVYYAVKCVKKYPVGTEEAVFQARELKLHKMVSNALVATRRFISRLF